MSQGDKASDSPASATTAGAGDGAVAVAGASSDADLAQAFRELARGEQQAAAMEANLTKLESKLDALLAQFEAAAQKSTPKNGTDENEDPEKDGEQQS